MKKSIFRLGMVLLLCALCALLFCACGDDATTPEQPGDGQTGGETSGGTGKKPEETPASKLSFELNEDGQSYTVTGLSEEGLSYFLDKSQIELVFPAAYQGLPVTVIGEGAFADWGDISMSVIIPNSVTSIERGAFCDCYELTSVTIPNSVTSIGINAFEHCGFASIVIPNSVTSIGRGAFDDCIGLTSVTIPDSVTNLGGNPFSGCVSLTSITVNAGNARYHSSGNCLIETESKTLIAGCKNSVIPSDGSVTTIGERAFDSCSSLHSVTIPNSVVNIGDYAFYGCQTLVEVCNKSDLSIEIGTEDNGYVGYYALNIYTPASGSSKLTEKDGYIFYKDGATVYLMGVAGTATSLTLPLKSPSGEAYSIYSYAFDGHRGLTSITIPDSVTSIGYSAFSDCKIREATIPTWAISNIPKDNLQTLLINGGTRIDDNAFGDYVFWNGTSCLTSITIPTSVTSIGEDAFWGCTAIREATMPTWAIPCIPKDSLQTVILNGGTSIGEYAFSGCEGLTSVTIPTSVTSIGEYAFSCCEGLTSVTIPTSVTSIGDDAFFGCTGLTSITIPNSVTSIGASAFFLCINLTSVTFANTDGWFITQDGTATDGEPVSVADPATNAANLLITYASYYWKRNV